MFEVKVEIPGGDNCTYATGKPCIMARYTKKWDAYNCKLYNRILKGGQQPHKCRQCIAYCEARNREQQG